MSTEGKITLPTLGENPLFRLCRDDPDVVLLFGANPCRIYPYGEAPQDTVTPFATWQLVAGTPGNLLAGRPAHDNQLVQIDVYAETGALCAQAAQSIIAAIECEALTDGWQEIREPETRDFRITFSADFILNRQSR